jgi:hypothetical protein
MPLRVTPAPTTGRKPQTGVSPSAERRAPALGRHLGFLLHLDRRGELAGLAEQELRLWRKSLGEECSTARLPSPLTAALRLEPSPDPGPDLPRLGCFDPARTHVAVSIEFLGRMSDLPPLGALPAAHAGDIFVGWVNLDRVEDLAGHPATVSVEALRGWLPTTGIGPAVRSVPSMPAALAPPAPQGRGVRIAIIDYGFDPFNPCFLDQAGTSLRVRTAWLHDMTVDRASGGHRFTNADLQQGLDWYTRVSTLRSEPDVVAGHFRRLLNIASFELRNAVQLHGTAVAGIALGNGRGSAVSQEPPPAPDPVAARGTAPLAEPVMIAVGVHDEERFADSADVLAAFAAAFEDPAMPCVALMANSDNLGPHDGTLHGETFLDEMLVERPGRAIVLSAGNANHSANAPATSGIWHALQDLGTAGGRASLTLRYGSGADRPDSAEVWFQPLQASPQVTLTGPEVGTVPVAEGTTDLPAMSGGTKVTVQLYRFEEADAHCLRLIFRPGDPSNEIVPGTWTLEMDAVGPVHGWLDRNNGTIGRWEVAGAAAGADVTTIGSPAVAARPLAVGSVRMDGTTVTPSGLSGRGPSRAAPVVTPVAPGKLKPDLVAVGESVCAPLAAPFDRVNRASTASVGDYAVFGPGTSFAAPQVAGACALAFERFGTDPAFGGSPATWADVRQAVLQAATRRDAAGASLLGMPPPQYDANGIPLPGPQPGDDGWDPACGFGLLDLNALVAPPASRDADAWIPAAPGDRGDEPFVAATFWESPAILLEDDDGRRLDPTSVAAGDGTPTRLRVRVGNRGRQVALGVTLRVWWTPLGALHPLPGSERAGRGARLLWNADGFRPWRDGGGNRLRLPDIGPGEMGDGVFAWTPPRDPAGRVLPHQVLAAVDAEGDRFDPDQLPCAVNNTAFLTVAAASAGYVPSFTILGSSETDGARIWLEGGGGGLRITGLPITALPWRDAAVFREANRRDRPLYDPDSRFIDDPMLKLADLELGEDRIAEMTDIQGAYRLNLKGRRVTLEGVRRIFLPRLRLAPGAPLTVRVEAEKPAAIHLLHLSGGRRVGGGTIRWPLG